MNDRIRVLIADDNEINRRFLVALLSGRGVVSDEAASGEDAIALWEKNRYDMILMDVHMPGIDGKTAAARISQLDGERGHTPIIAVTADVFLKAGGGAPGGGAGRLQLPAQAGE